MDIQLSLIVLVNVDAGKLMSERTRSNESCVSLHETSHTPILSTSSRDSEETMPIIESPIFVASSSQSDVESWIMQRESIQRYLTPILRVMVTASRNAFESDSIGMPSWRDWKLMVVVVVIGWRPQRWERVR